MSDTNSGGSATIPLPGMSGGTANISTPESTPPKTEENLPPQDAGKEISSTPNVDAKPAEKAVAKQENSTPTFQKEADEAREQVLDLLQEKFTQLKEGELNEEDLKAWFTKNPSFADTANRSKRLKEDFRNLMEKSNGQPATESKATPEDKPLTLKDLQAYDQEREARVLAKAQEREQQREFTDFAVKHKVVDADAKQLKINADALYKANPEWDYAKAVSTAYSTINPQKSAPTNISANSLGAPESQDTKIDATKGVQLISAAKFSGGQLKD